MTVLVKRGCAAALTYVIATQGAWADLTAEQVWNDWRAYLSGAGYELSVTDSRSGDDIRLENMALTLTMEDVAEGDDATFTVTIPEITLTGKGDGTVAVAMPAMMPITIDGEADGEALRVVLDYAQTGMSMIISGTPQDMTYNYTAAKAQLTLAELTVEGEAAPEGMLDLMLTMNNVLQSTRMSVGDLRSVSQDMKIGSLDYRIAFDDPDSEDAGLFEGRLVDLGFVGSGDIPLQMDPNDIRAMIDAGFNFEGGFRHGGGKTHVQVTGDGENVRIDSNSQTGDFQFAMGSEALRYALGQTGANIEMESGELPFPVAISMARAGFDLMMPVQDSDQAQDFALTVTLGDFVMSDMIWMMFDAGQVLPRDPASIIVDLAGKATLFFDIFDTEEAMEMGMDGTPPAELNQLTVNDLLVSAAGAELSGKGAFTFDNSDLESFDGLPRPEGTLDLKVVGANGLLDRLAQMGFVSEEEAMQTRMMMGVFASPAEGEDTLTSNIVANEQGHVIVNGQRLK